MGLWDEVKKIRLTGGVPTVVVPAGSRILDSARRQGLKAHNATPKKRPHGVPMRNPYDDRAHAVMKSPGGARLCCMVCNKTIRMYQANIVCSERCRRMMRRRLVMYLAILDHRMDARLLPMDMRSRHSYSTREERLRKKALAAKWDQVVKAELAKDRISKKRTRRAA